jgi:hypothetical protein
MNSCGLLPRVISCALIHKWECGGHVGSCEEFTLFSVFSWKVLHLILTQRFVRLFVVGTERVNLVYMLICAVTRKHSPPPPFPEIITLAYTN